MPHHVGLWVAVQQQDRRTLATDAGVTTDAVDVHVDRLETLEHGFCIPVDYM